MRAFTPLLPPASRGLTRARVAPRRRPQNSHVNAANQTVWNQPLVVPGTNQVFAWDVGQLTCSGGREPRGPLCDAAYSELQNRGFCPIESPERFPPMVQVVNPPYRPAGHDDTAWNEMWQAQTTGSTRDVTAYTNTANYSRPSPFLYTSSAATAAAAQLMANSMLFNGASTAFITQTLAALAASFASAMAQNLTTYQAALATPLARFAANVSGPIGDVTRVVEDIAMLPMSPMLLGTAQAQQRNGLQSDNAFLGRPLMYLTADCNSLPNNIRGNLSAVGAIFRSTMPCVSMPAQVMASTAAINTKVFTGYGRGSPGNVGLGSAYAGYPFAIDFGATNPTFGSGAVMAPTLFYNGTLVADSGQPLNHFFRLHAPMNRLVNAFLEAAMHSMAGPRATMRYVRDMPTQGASISLDVGTFLGPLFYTWLSQMLLPVIVGLLVYEKEKNLRTMMKIQGLGDSAYMLVNYMYYFLLYFVFMLLIYLYGAGLGFGTNSLSMWTRSQPGVVIIFFILFINVQITTAFLFQAIFSSAKTATVGSVVYLLIAGLLGKFLFESFLESPTFGHSGIVGMELLVPFSLYRGYYEMAAFGQMASYVPRGTSEASMGITWAKLKGSHGMDDVLVIFFVEWIVLGFAGYYLDQVYATGSGVKRHPLFFLECVLKDRLRARAAEEEAAAEAEAAAAVTLETEAPDVVACRDAALSIHDPSQIAILARGLGKTYPGLDGAPPKVACRELSVGIPAGECFGLLGPNGAGKSTAINLLIGFLTPSRGSAYIKGYNLQTDLDTVYSMLGVCPQHDLLWEQLTAREHLRFYGRLRNLAGPALEAACDEALQGVNLFQGGVGDRPCGTYSGGMKRRLSVAISLIGDPPVVFLDEPSTGLDPASRATLWDVIKKAKQQRAIVLTTHAMEEAEELCDRLGIFVDGSLRCVGNPKELTSRYGGFLVLTLTTAALRAEEAKAFVMRMSPNAQLTYALGGTLKFDLPLSENNLASVVAAVSDRKDALGIVDWGVANMTLEEVFIKLAREIGATTKE